jgi:hypothetical protein
MTKPIDYCVQKKNATAVNVLRAWLNAAKIPNAPSETSGFDISVERRGGGALEVAVVFSATTSSDGVVILAKDILSKSPKTYLKAFWLVTVAAGYESPLPLDRGAGLPSVDGKQKRLHYSDEDFLVTIRHREFRCSPDPPDDRWSKYRVVIEQAAWRFLKYQYEICARHGLEIQDLISYARCWTVNFVSQYETPTPVRDDNERKLVKYLQQRFMGSFLPVLQKKERSIMPSPSIVQMLSLNDECPDPSDAYVHALDNREKIALIRKQLAGVELTPEEEEVVDSFDFNDEDKDYVKRRCEIDLTTAKSRRQSASKKLTELLEKLPHDEMVLALNGVFENKQIDFVVRKEANKRLKRHQKGCQACLSEQTLDSDRKTADQPQSSLPS